MARHGTYSSVRLRTHGTTRLMLLTYRLPAVRWLQCAQSKPFIWKSSVPMSGQSAHDLGWDFPARHFRRFKRQLVSEADVQHRPTDVTGQQKWIYSLPVRLSAKKFGKLVHVGPFFRLRMSSLLIGWDNPRFIGFAPFRSTRSLIWSFGDRCWGAVLTGLEESLTGWSA